MSEPTAPTTLEELAGQLKDSYDTFTKSVKDLGSKSMGKSGGSKMAGSFLRWIGGSHVTTPREQLSEEFLTHVRSQLEFLTVALEGASPDEAARAAVVLADIMLEPVPVRSNATTDLMKRAMVSQFMPFLPHLPLEQVAYHYERLTAVYKRRDMLPVELTLVDAMEEMLRQ